MIYLRDKVERDLGDDKHAQAGILIIQGGAPFVRSPSGIHGVSPVSTFAL